MIIKYFALVLILLNSLALFGANSIVFLDNSVSNDTYIASNKENQIKIAFKLAIEDIKKKFPSCQLNQQVQVGRSGLLDIFNQVQKIKNNTKEKTFIVGLIHSSEAILASKAFKATDVLALSSGAASTEMHKTNSNFFSLANPTTVVSKVINNFLIRNKIKRIGALYPGSSLYSIELVKELKAQIGNYSLEESIDTSKPLKITESHVKDLEVIFIPGFIQQTLPIIKHLDHIGFKGIILGSPNLARSKNDLELYLKFLSLNKNKLYMPASWIENESSKSNSLERRFKSVSKEDIMGTAVFTYDATVIMGEFICTQPSYTEETFISYIQGKKFKNESLKIRNYTELKDGHLLSAIKIVEYDFNNKKFNNVK